MKTLVLLRTSNFHHHRDGCLPAPSWYFTVFLAVFLGAVSWKLPLTILHSSNSHLNAASFDPVWMQVGDTAQPPPTRPHPHSQTTDNGRGSADDIKRILPPPHWLIMFQCFSGGLCSRDQDRAAVLERANCSLHVALGTALSDGLN